MVTPAVRHPRGCWPSTCRASAVPKRRARSAAFLDGDGRVLDIRILDEWNIPDPHLVCPDVGTPAALFAAASHPGRIRSLVIGGGATAYPLDVAGTLKELIEAPGIDAFRSVDPRALVEGLMEPLGPAAPAGDVIADYVESNMGDRFAESARYVRSYPEQLPLLAGLLPQVFTPVQIIAGGRDRLVPVANAEFLARPAAQQPPGHARHRAPSLGRGLRRVRRDHRRLDQRRLPGRQYRDGPYVSTPGTNAAHRLLGALLMRYAGSG